MNARKYMLWFIIIVCFLPITPLFAQDKQKAVVVVEHWPPWEIAYDEEKQHVTGGMAVEIIQELFSRLNIEMVLETMPWRRALAHIQSGEADLIPILSETSERARFMVFTEPMYYERVLLCYSTRKMERFEWDSWDDLKSFIIGTVRGYEPVINSLHGHGIYNIEEAISDEMNLQKLIGGRIDLAVLYSTTLPLVKNLPEFDILKFAEKPVLETLWVNGISRKSFLVDRLPEINAVLKEMKRDGTFKRILKDYYQGE